MAVNRADTFTQTEKKKEFFSDFLDSFAPSPFSGALSKVTNENAVKQSVKNLVLTNLGERLFQPNIGTNVNRMLFEPYDALVGIELQNFIQTTLRYYEPRARDVTVNILPSDDQNYLEINIVFYVINNPNAIDLTLNLKRVR